MAVNCVLSPDMGDAYTPGLVVADYTRIEKARRLPLSGQVDVEMGASVKAADIVAHTGLPGQVHLMNFANKLGVIPQEVAACLQIQPGNPVKRGQVVARRTSFFGLFTTEIFSPIDGTLESVSDVTGQGIFRAPMRPVEVTAYIDGEVAKILDDEGVVVAADGALIQGIFGIGGEKTAPLVLISKAPGDVIDAASLTPELADKIIICGGRLTIEAARRAIELGITGIVCGGFAYEDVRDLLGYDVGVAVTGDEDIGTTIVVTEGFGDIAMAATTFALFEMLDGMTASINGATQIRAGVIRPEVVVPLKAPLDAGGGEGPYGDGEENAPQGLVPGAKVRCIRAPHFGKVGTVSELPVDLVKMPSETMVRVVKVEVDGELVMVPRANVELIEK